MGSEAGVSFHTASTSRPTTLERPAIATSTTIANTHHVERFSGDIDTQKLTEFSLTLDAIRTRRPERVVLDLTKVQFLSASALALLARFCIDDDGNAYGKLALACGRPVARLIEACGLPIDVHDTLDDAYTSLADS